MKFKSALGIAALEELNEDQVPAADNAAVATDAGATPAADTPAADPAPAGNAAAAEPAGDADAGAAGNAGAAADAAADTGAANAEPAGTGSDDAAAASAVDSATAQVDATGEPAAVVAEAAPMDADAEVVEEQMGEVDQIEEKTTDVQEDVEKLEAATESLEGCVAILDAAVQRGGLDIYGASLLRNNVNTVTKSLKVKPLMLPALEDMETPSSKTDGAQTAKDQIVAFIKRIIEAIKSAFIRLGEWIVETYKRLTDAFVALERRAEKLSERVKTGKMKEGALDNKSLAAKLTTADNGIPKDIPDMLSRLAAISKFLNDPASYKSYLEAIDLCEDMIKSPEKTEEISGQISAKLSAWSTELNKKSEGKNTPDNNDSNYFELFDRQIFGVKLPVSARDLNNMSSYVHTVETAKASDSVTALSQAEAEKICEIVVAISKQVRESASSNRGGVKELMAEIAKRKETLIAMSNAGIKNTTGGLVGDGEFGTNFRKVVMFVNGLLMTAPKLPVHAINKALPRNLGIALDYVAASIGMTQVDTGNKTAN